MRRALSVLLLALVATLTASRVAHADEPRVASRGVAVLAADGATDAAWPLARAVYASALLRSNVDDAHARVLAGERPPTPSADASRDLTELAELRAGVKGDDAASREVLAAIAQKISVVAIVVVFAGDPPTARVFDVATRSFDAARYSPDAASTANDPKWDGAIHAIERPFAPQNALTSSAAPLVMTPPPTAKKSESKAFYESPWFWVAIGAAVLIGGGVLIATNVQSSDTIHLKMRLP